MFLFFGMFFYSIPFISIFIFILDRCRFRCQEVLVGEGMQPPTTTGIDSIAVIPANVETIFGEPMATGML